MLLAHGICRIAETPRDMVAPGMGNSLHCLAPETHVQAIFRLDTLNLPQSIANVRLWALVNAKHVAYRFKKHGRDILGIWEVRENTTALDDEIANDVEQDI